PSPTSAPSTGSSNRTARGPTARSSVSTAPCKPNGPTDASTPATPGAPTPYPTGYRSTTNTDPTPPWPVNPRSAGCQQGHDRVHLARAGTAPPARVALGAGDGTAGVPERWH